MAQNFKYIFYGEGGGGGIRKMIWRGMKILSIFWGGGKQNWTRFFFFFGGGGVISMQFLGPVLSSMYKIQNGDSLGVAKISFLFIYLFLN